MIGGQYSSCPTHRHSHRNLLRDSCAVSLIYRRSSFAIGSLTVLSAYISGLMYPGDTDSLIISSTGGVNSHYVQSSKRVILRVRISHRKLKLLQSELVLLSQNNRDYFTRANMTPDH